MKILDSNFWIIFTLLIALSGLALWRGGTPFLGEALGGGMKLFLRFGLLLFVSFLVAGLAEAVMPTSRSNSRSSVAVYRARSRTWAL